jgi:hypothetical protein
MGGRRRNIFGLLFVVSSRALGYAPRPAGFSVSTQRRLRAEGAGRDVSLKLTGTQDGTDDLLAGLEDPKARRAVVLAQLICL